MRWVGRTLAAAVTALLALAPASGAAAQAEKAPSDGYPARPIRIVVPFPPGAGTDIIARMLAQVLGEAWRQTVIVDNRTGAGGTIGSDIVAKASPDGYTLLLGNVSTLALAPSLYPKLPYVPLRDFAPITLITTSHNVLVTHPSVPANSVKELIALAKARPGQLTYGSAGSGTTSHLGGALFAHMAGVQLVHVPYKGSAPAHVDLLAGQLQLSFSTIVTTLPFIKSGRLKGLAVTSLNRSPLLPHLPTVAETLPGFEVLVWQGIVAPAAAPRAIIARLNQEIAKSLHGPHMREYLAKQGLEAVGNTPEEFAAFIQSETGKWGKVIRLTGARAE
jgi:tripartite-type tricarboxylate transporter receptor subunit TctC